MLENLNDWLDDLKYSHGLLSYLPGRVITTQPAIPAELQPPAPLVLPDCQNKQHVLYSHLKLQFPMSAQ